MLDYNGETVETISSNSLKIGSLVFINDIFRDVRKCGNIGIIIGCRYGFGYGLTDWIVLLNGKVSVYSAGVLWPIEEVLYEKI